MATYTPTALYFVDGFDLESQGTLLLKYNAYVWTSAFGGTAPGFTSGNGGGNALILDIGASSTSAPITYGVNLPTPQTQLGLHLDILPGTPGGSFPSTLTLWYILSGSTRIFTLQIKFLSASACVFQLLGPSGALIAQSNTSYSPTAWLN